MAHLVRTVVAGGVVYPAGTASSPQLASLIASPDHWDGPLEPALQPGVGGDPAAVDYGSWSKPDLVAEIEIRNADRDTPIQVPGKGNKPDLIAALEADDQS